MKTVVFETLWASPFDGWSIAARAYARAMLLAGWDVRLKSPVMVFSEKLSDEVRKYLPLERPTTPLQRHRGVPGWSRQSRSYVYSTIPMASRPVCAARVQ